uniref:Uncharacterized protein n=1 Tax=Anguilla anguilla TaxID=7936 RepID=A0A0E9XW03_ANGAN
MIYVQLQFKMHRPDLATEPKSGGRSGIYSVTYVQNLHIRKKKKKKKVKIVTECHFPNYHLSAILKLSFQFIHSFITFYTHKFML